MRTKIFRDLFLELMALLQNSIEPKLTLIDPHLDNFFDLLTTQSHTICRRALRFATQISPLLNLLTVLQQVQPITNYFKTFQTEDLRQVY